MTKTKEKDLVNSYCTEMISSKLLVVCSPGNSYLEPSFMGQRSDRKSTAWNFTCGNHFVHTHTHAEASC